MRPNAPLRIPLALTCTLLVGGGVSFVMACGTHESNGPADASKDAQLEASPEESGVRDSAVEDTRDAIADTRVADVAQDAIADTAIADVSRDTTADSTVPSEPVYCLELRADGAPVFVDGSEDFFLSDSGDCPDGDEAFVA